jgi:hypothetical protein
MVLWPTFGDGHLGVLDSKVGISNVERKRKMLVRVDVANVKGLFPPFFSCPVSY